MRSLRSPVPTAISPHRLRAAFTLIELLVVIAIIGMLMMLVSPAIQKVRESGRQTVCKSNLYNLGRAVQSHVAKFDQYPTGGWGYNWVGNSNSGHTEKQPGGWVFNILPYVERLGVYEMDRPPDAVTPAQFVAANQTRMGQPLEFMNCPTRRPSTAMPVMIASSTAPVNGAYPTSMSVGRSDYAINCGAPTTVPGSPANFCYVPSPGAGGGPTGSNLTTLGMTNVQSTATAAGMRAYWGISVQTPPAGTQYALVPPTRVLTAPEGTQPRFTGVSFVLSNISPAALKHGLSYTYLIGEKSIYPDQYQSGSDPNDTNGTNTALPMAGDSRTMYNGFGPDNYRSADDPPLADNSLDSTKATLQTACRFGGPHSTGFFMVFCDGAVHLIRYNIDPNVHKLLANRSWGEAPSDDTFN